MTVSPGTWQMSRQGAAIHRTEWLVLVFFLAAWATVITILAVSP